MKCPMMSLFVFFDKSQALYRQRLLRPRKWVSGGKAISMIRLRTPLIKFLHIASESYFLSCWDHMIYIERAAQKPLQKIKFPRFSSQNHRNVVPKYCLLIYPQCFCNNFKDWLIIGHDFKTKRTNTLQCVNPNNIYLSSKRALI